MNIFPFSVRALIAVLAVMGATVPAAPAQEASPAAPAPQQGAQLPQVEIDIATPEAREARDKFQKLSAGDQEKFFKLLNEGEKLLGERRVPEALQKFNDAEAYWAIHPNLLNLKGAALVNIRDFERASKYFDIGVRAYPTFWQIRFNLAEMNFVRKNWADSDTQFRNLLEQEKQMDVGTRKLIEFKIILILIKQKKYEEAEKMTKKYDIFDDSPIFFYANAALNFEKEDRKKAEEWVTNARAIYNPALSSIYEDSLTELGWLFVF